MKLATTFLMLSALILTAAPSTAQTPPPPRTIGSVQVDALTSAPVRLVRSISLHATPTDVFAFVTDHANWPAFLGAIESVEVKGDGHRGSTRTFTVTGGATLAERIVAFDEPGKDGTAAFAYAIGPENPFGVQNHLAVIELRTADSGGTVLGYHQLYDHPDPNAIAPAVAAGTDEILGNILYRFGGELRGATEGSTTVTILQRRVIDASTARAWRVLGEQWGEVDKWASVIAHSQTDGTDKASLEGVTRSCEVPGTPGFRETMLAYDEDALELSYRVIDGMPPFVTRAVNYWDIEPLGAERVVVSSRVELDIAPGTPDVATGMAAGQFTQLLDLTADELAHYIETGRPHPRKVVAQQMMSGK
ncbi:MAG: SRPBCC family protein [Acidobacteriota bacterium]